MKDLKSIIVGGKKYTIEPLNVFDTLEMQSAIMIKFSPALSALSEMMSDSSKKDIKDIISQLSSIDNKAMIDMFKKSLAQTYTDENKPLSNEMYIEDWFNREENKGSVWEVAIVALLEVVGEHLPKPIATMLQSIKGVVMNMTALSTEQFQKNSGSNT